MQQQQCSAAADQWRHHHHVPDPPDFFVQFFPQGLKVLLVGTDNATKASIQRELRPPHYHITLCDKGSSALQHLQGKDSSFDLVLSDVLLQDMDGCKFISEQRSNTNIPHVVICRRENIRSDTIIRTAFVVGACYILWKPVNECEVRNLWQHVCQRREQHDHHQLGETDFFNSSDVDDNHHGQNQMVRRQHHHHQDEGSSSLAVSRDKHPRVEDDIDEFVNNNNNSNNIGERRSSKRPRLVWSPELRQKFAEAMDHLGEKAVPKSILDYMSRDYDYLTRENVASHLQKYRQAKLKKKEEEEKRKQQYQQMNEILPAGEGSYGRFNGNNSNNNNNTEALVHEPFLHPGMCSFQPPQNPNNNPGNVLEPSWNTPSPLQQAALMSNCPQFFFPGHPYMGSLASGNSYGGSNLTSGMQHVDLASVPYFFVDGMVKSEAGHEIRDDDDGANLYDFIMTQFMCNHMNPKNDDDPSGSC